jgi:hypothetical protein
MFISQDKFIIEKRHSGLKVTLLKTSKTNIIHENKIDDLKNQKIKSIEK